MASSSKASSSKKRPAPSASDPPVRKKLSVRPVDRLDFEAVHRVAFHAELRELGTTPDNPDALFLPASAEECSSLVNHWKHLPNSAPPAFSLSRYNRPEDVSFSEVLDQNIDDIRPDTFYPRLLTTFCKTFETGPVSRAEGFQLFQALSFLQHGFSRIIRGHLAKPEIHRRLLAFTNLDNFSDSLQYYQLYWHGHQNCPLVAPLLVILICEFCEEHLTEGEYAARVYDARVRDGPGMSTKTRDRLLEDIPESPELHELAVPLPLDPSTREGQLLLRVSSQGSRVDKIVHPISLKVLVPDASFTVTSPPKPKRRLRPLSPDFDEPPTAASTPTASKNRPLAQPFPVSDDPIILEEDEPDTFKGPAAPDVLIVRQSIARAAKAKPKLPDELRQAPAPLPAKRERSPAEVPPILDPPTKKRRTSKAAGKARAGSPVLSRPDPPVIIERERLRIQEGEPDYFYGDDVDTTTHHRFLTNPHFQPKTPFSDLIAKATDANKRGAKIPFLRPPKWNVSDELKDFGAFATIGDTTFSLQGLSRFGYASSRFLWPTNNRTLPSPESLYSTNNCLTCISRGEVCESSDKPGGACRQCNGTHRSCTSCLSLEDHRDRFLALHNHVQGYPNGYAAALDQYATALDHITKLQSTFAPLFQDAQQALLKGMQTVRSSGFDLNVVLSRWAEDNPNLPLDYDIVTWLATLFGWTSSCNLVDYLSTPEDQAKLAEFMRDHPPIPSSSEPPFLDPTPLSPRPSSSITPATPLPSVTAMSEPLLRSRRRPAAGVPVNFSSSQQSHTPLASTTADEELEIEEGTSRTSVAQALVAEYDDSDEDGDAGADTDEAEVEVATPAFVKSPKIRK
ncbi:hypothetical protein C8R42DRAFT_725565 [Lentinula raphanica]|nr:hypothetical protein C8R42DRAFT_725565 [Lentinula raphanica]